MRMFRRGGTRFADKNMRHSVSPRACPWGRPASAWPDMMQAHLREVPMYPTPKSALTPNTYSYESEPLVKPTGFREYDARWLLETEINLMGVQALGMGLGTLI